MKIGAMNNPARDLYSEIRFIGENRFDFIDLTIEPVKAYSEAVDVKRVKALLKRYRLPAIGHTPWSFPVSSPVPDLREAAYREFLKCLDVFSALGIKLVNIHPSVPREKISSDELLAYNLEFYDRIVNDASRRGIEIMLENAFHPFDTLEIFAVIFEEVPKLKLHVDIGHLNLGGEAEIKTEMFFRHFRKRIAHVHFSDNHGNDDEHLPLGVGTIDWSAIIKIMKRYRYDKTITLEIHAEDRSYLLFNREKLRKFWGRR